MNKKVFNINDSSETLFINQRKIHKDAYKLISDALKLEEQFTDMTKESKMKAIGLYKSGVIVLKRGISTNLVGQGSDWDRIREVQKKMHNNIVLAEERISILMEEYNKQIKEIKDKESAKRGPGTRIPPRNTTRGAPRGSTKPYIPDSTSTNRDSARKTTRKYVPMKSRPSSPATSTLHRSVEQKLSLKGYHDAMRTKTLKGVDNDMAKLILNEIIDTDLKICFDDISHMPAKQALQETVILPSVRPELFTGLRSPGKGILLFGPPGNGKTMLAKAVSKESKTTFFNISASSLTSKYLGESEKLVRALFVIARNLQPSIIFFDEIDSLLCKRKESEHEASRRIKTEFMLQFDGITNDSESCRVLVMGCTNRPFELDTAVLRRFPKRIYISNPDQKSRLRLIEKMLEKQKHSISSSDFQNIARLTEGYSCSDLTALVRDAALAPIRELRPDQIIVIPESKMRGISFSDVQSSLSSIRGSVTNENMKQLNEWNQCNGDVKT